MNSCLYKQVNIGGSGCNAAISGGQNVSFVGEEHVWLGEGFSVDANSTFWGDVKPCTTYFENARIGPPNISPQPIPPAFIKRTKLKINSQ